MCEGGGTTQLRALMKRSYKDVYKYIKQIITHSPKMILKTPSNLVWKRFKNVVI